MSPPRDSSWHGAAVAILIAGPPGAQEVLFIERAHRPLDPWSGDMAFPGGFRDPRDDDALATAQRETLEEVGLRLPAPSRRLPWRWAFHPRDRRPLRLVPFVFHLAQRPALDPEPTEVSATVWIPLAHLIAARRRQWLWIRGILPWPAPVRWWGDRRIWGLTGAMVDDLVRALGGAGRGAHDRLDLHR
ncbi:MAG TPA: CoA pyrophosphatase [Deltaproteobacteria bacterium]|nr:CoA pyrophosphatase [Deltaproteobacteria bacterium]